MQRTARLDHPEVREIVPSHHCVVRFRQRRPFRELGTDAVMEALTTVLEDCHVSGWAPAWAHGDRDTALWAATADLAFPLERTATPGRWLATTCLSRADRR
ncbi:MAG: hypothetical protein JW895_14435 [Thermoleophilaceae bacterium]|nr:hypothetical protein [Thermoleophilaceae bacterium]